MLSKRLGGWCLVFSRLSQDGQMRSRRSGSVKLFVHGELLCDLYPSQLLMSNWLTKNAKLRHLFRIYNLGSRASSFTDTRPGAISCESRQGMFLHYRCEPTHYCNELCMHDMREDVLRDVRILPSHEILLSNLCSTICDASSSASDREERNEALSVAAREDGDLVRRSETRQMGVSGPRNLAVPLPLATCQLGGLPVSNNVKAFVFVPDLVRVLVIPIACTTVEDDQGRHSRAHIENIVHIEDADGMIVKAYGHLGNLSPWFGPVVVLKFDGQRCDSYRDVCNTDMMVLRGFFNGEWY
ncbi:hypothetical protein C8T65DRAFT_695174 [Cerioporus squamosus]|nr:hypothetical protein C8T65DRAFT_695174 [Cerioporus squamosus]